MRSLVLVLLAEACASAASGNIIADVRAAIARKDFRLGESQIQAYRAQQGVTPEMLEALSWLGRGALAAKQFDAADRYAAETRRLALAELARRKLDAEKHLPIALGASIEVHARVLEARGEHGQAISFLRDELNTFRDTSMRARIQKNIHLLSLEGKPAPALEVAQWLGPKPAPVERLRGHPVLLFFWAHWCGDCRGEAPALAKLLAAYGPKGLVLIGPTQRYGYVAGGEDAAPDQEIRYIDQVRRQVYIGLENMPVPVSEENFKNYGASTTPTLVLLDRSGIVRLYYPGSMPYEALAAKVAQVIAE